MSSYYVLMSGREYQVEIRADGTVEIGGFDGTVSIEPLSANTCSVLMEGSSLTVVSARNEDSYHALLANAETEVRVETERERQVKRYAFGSGNSHKRLEVRAPMPALIARVEVVVGEEVSAGQGLLVLEAMKMENEIKAHQPGNVKEVFVTNGATVEKGQLLMLLE